MQPIMGRLYPPLQYVSFVDKEGAAYEGGVRIDDRILSVNESDVTGSSHKQVVDHVLRGGDNLKLRVVRVDKDEALRLKRIEEAGELGKEVKPLAHSMPKYTVKNRKEVNIPKPHTTFNIFYGTEFVCAKRYSEFKSHHDKMVKRFRWFTFPEFPPKKLNGFFSGAMALTESEKDDRRTKLNEYLVKVMAVEDIASSPLMVEFLGHKPETSKGQLATGGDKASPAKKAAAAVEAAADDGGEGGEAGGAKQPKKAALFAAVALDLDEDDDDNVLPTHVTVERSAAEEEEEEEEEEVAETPEKEGQAEPNAAAEQEQTP